jgi:hypothetical protein
MKRSRLPAAATLPALAAAPAPSEQATSPPAVTLTPGLYYTLEYVTSAHAANGGRGIGNAVGEYIHERATVPAAGAASSTPPASAPSSSATIMPRRRERTRLGTPRSNRS